MAKPTDKNTNSEKPGLFQSFANSLNDVIFGVDSNSDTEQVNRAETLLANNRTYLVSNMRQLLSQTYVEHGVIQTAVDVPVDDAFRGGVTIQSQQLSEEELNKLIQFVEREDLISTKLGHAHKLKRLFGGAGIIIMTDQDPTTPLDLDAIQPGELLDFRVADMWELDAGLQADKTAVGEPYGVGIPEFYRFYGLKIHKSRVIRLKGLEAPSFVRPRLRGWGFSIVETILAPYNIYLKTTALSFEVLDEFKLDIFRMEGLNNTLIQKDGEMRVRNRISLANKQKSYKNGMVLDSKDEYEQKQVSFAGIADMVKENRIQLAATLRIPLAKLYGLSAAGFNSGEDDIENYNAMVESTIRSRSKYELIFMLELVCQYLFGHRPTDLRIDFKPLRVLSAEQDETVKSAKHARLLATEQAGLMTVKEFKEACNRDGLLPIQLDTSIDKLDSVTDDGDPNAKEKDGEEKDGEDDTDEADADSKE